MEPRDERLAELSAFARDELSRRAKDADFTAKARVAFLNRGAKKQSRTGMWLALSATALVPVGALALWMMPTQASFRVGDDVAGSVGAWINSADTATTELAFSEGSTVQAAPMALLRVKSLSKVGSVVELGHGKVNVHVVHCDQTRWKFDAGPFAVHVTGTKFDLAWSPDKHELRLSMQEGSVNVQGCDWPQPRRFSAGDTLVTTCPPAAPVVASKPQEPQIAVPLEAPAPAVAPERVAGTARSTTWGDLYAKGQFKEAFAQAQADGFNRECAKRSAADVLSLAELARLTGNLPEATHALSTVRTRFARSTEAATAAFALGRMAVELQNNKPQALQWFQLYVAERPAGSLAEDAFGRWITLATQTENRDSAVKAAKLYLARFPQGRYASLANEVLAH
jgi:transmembrane sensor